MGNAPEPNDAQPLVVKPLAEAPQAILPQAVNGQAAAALPYAGFWARGAAAGVDCFVLYLAACVIGLPLAALWVRVGPPAAWVGFALTLAYWGLLNSTLGGGQNIGKRLLHIRVVGEHGAPVGPARGLLRAAVLVLPYYLHASKLGQPAGPAAALETLSGRPPTAAATAYLVLGACLLAVGLLQAYLALFNAPARRCLHDLACGTYVVRAGNREPPPIARLARVHVPILIVLAVLVIVTVVHLQGVRARLARQVPGLSELAAVAVAAMDIPGVRTANANTTQYVSAKLGKSDARSLNVQVWWRGEPQPGPEAVADEVARILFDKYRAADQADMVTIRVTRSWSLGLASQYRTDGLRYPPAEWRERLRTNQPAGGAAK